MVGRIGSVSVAILLSSLLLGAAPNRGEERAIEGSRSVSELAWLAGHWRGEGLGGICEEIWSAPMAGTMVGSFRLIKDGEVSFYELMVLTPEEDGIVLKVKHFTPEFVGWEEKEDAVRFVLEDVEPNHARFKGLTMVRDGRELEIKIRMRYDDGSTREEPIRLKRYEPGAETSGEF